MTVCDIKVTVSNYSPSPVKLKLTPVSWPNGWMSPLHRHDDARAKYGPMENEAAKRWIASLRSGVTTRIAPNVSFTFEEELEVDHIRDVCSDLESAGLTVVFRD